MVHLSPLGLTIVLWGTVVTREVKTDSVQVCSHVTEIWTTPQCGDTSAELEQSHCCRQTQSWRGVPVARVRLQHLRVLKINIKYVIKYMKIKW